MKVKVHVYGEGEYGRDTLESRMVDTFLLKLKENFEKNSVPTTIFKTDTDDESMVELIKY